MKHRLRSEMKAALAAMDNVEAERLSVLACRAVVGLEEFDKARSVMLYAPIPGEVNCRPIAVEAWKRDKTVLLPKTSWHKRHMEAVPVHSLNHPVVEKQHGLREPEGEHVPVEEIDLIVVPGLAFDRAGNRLGRGGGFYDRFLARPGLAAHTCGIAFPLQLIEELPVHPNDYPVKVLVTDNQVLRFAVTAARENAE